MEIGEHVLEIAAKDVWGTEAYAYRRFIFDNKPELTIFEPVNYTVATPILSIKAVCTDDSNNCEITVQAEHRILETKNNELDADIDLSAYNGRSINLIVEGEDSLGQVVREIRYIYVDSADSISLVASVPGSIIDLNKSQILYKVMDDDGDSLHVYDWIDEINTKVEVPSGKTIDPDSCYLTPTGVIYVAEDIGEDILSARIYDWRNDVLNDLGYPNLI